jgi:hypothetical protein
VRTAAAAARGDAATAFASCSTGCGLAFTPQL